MAAANDRPTALGKRTVEDVEIEGEGPAQGVGDTKRRRIEANSNESQDRTQGPEGIQRLQDSTFTPSSNPEDYAAHVAEDPPQTWTSRKFDVLFENLEMQNEQPTQLEHNVQDEQVLRQNLQIVSDWTRDQENTEQVAEAAEQCTTQRPKHPNIEDEDTELAFEITKQPKAVSGTIPQKGFPGLSPLRPIQPASYGRRNPPKQVFPAADVPAEEGLSLPEFCAKWPNHLTGVHLRRFIQEDWKAGKIFFSMHPDARDALTKEASLARTLGWEIIQQRLDDEKKTMLREEEQARLETRKETSALKHWRPISPRTKYATIAETQLYGAITPSPSLGVKKKYEPRESTQAPGHGSEDAQYRAPLEQKQKSAQALNANSVPTQTAVQNDGIPAAISRGQVRHIEEHVEFPRQGLDQGGESQQPGTILCAQPNIGQTSQVGLSSQLQAFASTSPSEYHRDQCRQELDKQDLVLELLFSGSGWKQLSASEKHRRIKEEWVTKARESERNMISKFNIEESDIDFQSTGKGNILVRPGELIKRAFLQNNPLSPGASAQERGIYRARMVTTLKRKQLSTLRYWTAQWEQELSDRPLAVSGTSYPTDTFSPEEVLLTNAPHGSKAESSVLPASIEQQSLGALFQGSRQEGSVLRGDTHFNQQRSSPPSTERFEGTHPNHGQHQIASDFGFRNGSLNFTHSHPVNGAHGQFCHQYLPFVSQNPALVLPWPANLGPESLMYPSSPSLPPPDPSLPLQPFLNSGNDFPAPVRTTIYPQHASVLPMASPSNSSTIMVPQNKKRGAPRARMFNRAYRTEVPLSVRAQAEDEEVLKTFPEHLSIPEVMQRFVRQPGSRSGGWATQRMIDFLEPHPNSKDFPGITRAQRRANLKKWVIKERDMCNNHQRKAAGTSRKKVNENIDSPKITLQSPVVPTSQPSVQPVNTATRVLPKVAQTIRTSCALETEHDRREKVADSALGSNDFQAYWQIMDPPFVNLGPTPEVRSRQSHWQQGMAQSSLPADCRSEELDEPNVTGQTDDESWEAYFDFGN
jgi:hypothetical protein